MVFMFNELFDIRNATCVKNVQVKSGQRKTTCSRMDEEEQVAFPLVALFRKWDFEELHRKKI